MPTETAKFRKYPRIRAPKGLWVAWKSSAQQTTSRAEVMGLGGLFLQAAQAPSDGSYIELIFDLPTGQVRGRAIVRDSKPGKGMGIQFVQMKPEDRAKLHRFLTSLQTAPQASTAPVANSAPAIPHSPAPHSAASRLPNRQLAISPRSEKQARLRFEREVKQLIELTGKSTYYQLLEVSSDTPGVQVKKNYYSLVRKFHPDNHMGNRELITPLKNLMVVISEAYKTLANEEKRAAYDKSLAAAGGFSMMREKTGAEESIDEWMNRANECLRAQNFVGSIVWLRKCHEAAPESALYLAMLARSLGTISQYENEAVELFQKAIDLDPWKVPVYLQFGELLEEMELPERACAVYSKVLEISPLNAKAHERLELLKPDEDAENRSSRIPYLFGRRN
ncbi:MAG TPA: DnaJ domain-containing protein [Candidatus Acidoferrales bacterium]|nr:DnaJ domain-containing protein [Candidatus Acidoferrales bacterium]